jgi:hypothetical protein
VLACHREVAIPLFVYPVARDCASLVVTLYGVADGAAASTAINMRLALQDVGGRVYDPDRDSPTAVTTNASAQVVTLTFDDVGAVRGQPVTVWLVYSSEDNVTEGADDKRSRRHQSPGHRADAILDARSVHRRRRAPPADIHRRQPRHSA